MRDLVAAKPNPDARAPTREIVIRITGNMERYMWSLNGVPFEQAPPVNVQFGERVRITFVNETMMAHPMHLHGMFFEIENGAPADVFASANRKEMDAAVAARAEYMRFPARLADDDLPRFVDEFESQLRKNTIRELAGFHNWLLRQADDIGQKIEKTNEALGAIEERLAFPLVVKPARMGSALGIKFARATADVPTALIAAFSTWITVIWRPDGAHGMYSWFHVALATACAVGAWYWLHRAPSSTPSPALGEPPLEPDANAARPPGAH